LARLAWIDGNVMDLEQARISINDRALFFGDGCYEVVAVHSGCPFLLGPHLERLNRSLTELSIPFAGQDSFVTSIFEDLIRSYGEQQATIYLQISRGIAPRSHDWDPEMKPSLFATIGPQKRAPEDLFEKGVAVATTEDFRWGRCDIKSLNLLPNVMMKQKAKEKGLYEYVFLGPDDIVREATSSNVMIVSGGRVVTHPLDNRILPGITRAKVLEVAREGDIEYQERRFPKEEMLQAEEVFMTGTTTEVLPVVEVDSVRIADGKMGPVTRDLQQRLERLLRENS